MHGQIVLDDYDYQQKANQKIYGTVSGGRASGYVYYAGLRDGFRSHAGLSWAGSYGKGSYLYGSGGKQLEKDAEGSAAEIPY